VLAASRIDQATIEAGDQANMRAAMKQAMKRRRDGVAGGPVSVRRFG